MNSSKIVICKEITFTVIQETFCLSKLNCKIYVCNAVNISLLCCNNHRSICLKDLDVKVKLETEA